MALCVDGRVYAWGKDDDGQLGLGAQGARTIPTLIESLSRGTSLNLQVLDASCGWSHTALLVSIADQTTSDKAGQMLAPPRISERSSSSKRRRLPRLFVWGDFEGLFGQILGTSIQFMLMERLLRSSCGFTSSMVTQEMLPGGAAVYISGHAFFAVQGTLLSRKTGAPVTALPQGINIVTFFAFSQLIMAPTYRNALREGATQDEASRESYNHGLCACVLLGGLELIGVLFVEQLRTHIPRAAMLSAIAGVSLTFIALGFAVQIFAAPATAMVSMLLMLLFYGGQVKLPFRVPGGVIAVAAGWAIAVISGSLGYAWFSPASPEPTLPNTDGTGAIVPPPTIAFPHLQLTFLATFLQPQFWGCLSVVVPMWLVTLVNNLANIEAASAVGDHYDPQTCLLGCALIDLLCAFLGNPFPSCVYIGHAAFKAMGCRVGYLYLNMAPTLYFGCMRGAGLLQQIIPIESGVGFLMWIGLQITAQGFESDNTPEGWRHGPAVALGLIPSIAAWSWQTVATTYQATRGLLCDAMRSDDERANTPWCDLELHELMQEPSTPMAPASTALGTFQRNLSPLFLSGMYTLSNGYLLTAIALSSMLVHIIDGKFDRAAMWLLLSAVASALGIIHNTKLDPFTSNPLFPAMYLLAEASVMLCHASQNRSEQLRELQLKWVRRLIACSERFPSTPAPIRRAITTLGKRLGLLPKDYQYDAFDDHGDSGRQEGGPSGGRDSGGRPSRQRRHSSEDGLGLIPREDSRPSLDRQDSDNWRGLFVDVPDWISHSPKAVRSPPTPGGSGGPPDRSEMGMETPHRESGLSEGERDAKEEPLLENAHPV